MLPLLSQTQFGLAIGCHWFLFDFCWFFLDLFGTVFWGGSGKPARKLFNPVPNNPPKYRASVNLSLSAFLMRRANFLEVLQWKVPTCANPVGIWCRPQWLCIIAFCDFPWIFRNNKSDALWAILSPYQSLYITIISVQHIARHDGAPGLSPKVAVEVGRLEHIMGKKAIHVATKILSGTESPLWKFKRRFKSPQQHSEASARSIPDSGKCGVWNLIHANSIRFRPFHPNTNEFQQAAMGKDQVCQFLPSKATSAPTTVQVVPPWGGFCVQRVVPPWLAQPGREMLANSLKTWFYRIRKHVWNLLTCLYKILNTDEILKITQTNIKNREKTCFIRPLGSYSIVI